MRDGQAAAAAAARPLARVSVSDKAGLAELAAGLAELGYEVVSTGGSAKAVEAAGVAVTQVDQVTG